MSELDYSEAIREILSPHDFLAEHAGIPSHLRVGDLTRPVPQISIVIPSYRGGEMFREALKSAMEQTVSAGEYEIVIVCNDPASDASTVQIAREIGGENVFCYQNEENIGAGGNWNRCLFLARTPWVCMLHDDDLALPTAVASAMEAIKKLNQHDDLGLVLPRLQSFTEESSREKRQEIPLTPILRLANAIHGFLKGNHKAIRLSKNEVFKQGWGHLHAPTCCTLMRRQAILDMGGWGTDCPAGDVIFLSSFCGQYRGYAIDEVWGCYRWADNDSLNPRTIAALSIAQKQLLEYVAQGHSLHALDARIWGNIFFHYFLNSCVKRMPEDERSVFLSTYFPTLPPSALGKRTEFLYRLRVYPVATICGFLQVLCAKNY